MSFGRTPYYIYRCSNRGSEGCPNVDHVHSDGTVIEWDALAQFVASAANRQPPDELLELVRRGKALRPDIAPTLEVQVTGAGWVDAPAAEAATLPRQTAEVRQAPMTPWPGPPLLLADDELRALSEWAKFFECSEAEVLEACFRIVASELGAADDQAEAQARRTGKEPPPPEFVLKFFATLMSRKVLREHLPGRGG